MTEKTHHGYLGLGSNLGDRRKHLAQARRLMEMDQRLKLVKCSRLYRSQPVGFASDHCFLNQTLEVEWSGPLSALLNLARRIEFEMGRDPKLQPGEAASTDEVMREITASEVRKVFGKGKRVGTAGLPADNPQLYQALKSHALQEFQKATAKDFADNEALNEVLEAMTQIGQIEGKDAVAVLAAAAGPAVRRYFDRTIDIDLLHFDGVHSELPEMILPHPRAHLRAFVLLPLRELAPGLVLHDKPLDAWIAELPPEQLADCKPVSEHVGA